MVASVLTLRRHPWLNLVYLILKLLPHPNISKYCLISTNSVHCRNQFHLPLCNSLVCNIHALCLHALVTVRWCDTLYRDEIHWSHQCLYTQTEMHLYPLTSTSMISRYTLLALMVNSCMAVRHKLHSNFTHTHHLACILTNWTWCFMWPHMADF